MKFDEFDEIMCKKVPGRLVIAYLPIMVKNLRVLNGKLNDYLVRRV
ncbi:MAG: hypothetical protein V3U02_02365 [Calditrichia bacterium]